MFGATGGIEPSVAATGGIEPSVAMVYPAHTQIQEVSASLVIDGNYKSVSAPCNSRTLYHGSNNGNCLHTIAAIMPNSALKGKSSPKVGVKVHFIRSDINLSRVHESKYRVPLQLARNPRGPDVFTFGTLCELIEWRRHRCIDPVRSAEEAFARAQFLYFQVEGKLPTFVIGDGTPCDTTGEGIPIV